MTPVTTPDEEPTVACAVLLLLHVPVAGVEFSVVVVVGQTLPMPVIVVGNGFMVTVTVVAIVLVHPLVASVAFTE